MTKRQAKKNDERAKEKRTELRDWNGSRDILSNDENPTNKKK